MWPSDEFAICNQFGCKFRFYSNSCQRSFLSFVHSHLKRLCSSRGIWAGALLLVLIQLIFAQRCIFAIPIVRHKFSLLWVTSFELHSCQSPPKPQNKLCGAWFLFRSIEDAKMKPKLYSDNFHNPQLHNLQPASGQEVPFWGRCPAATTVRDSRLLGYCTRAVDLPGGSTQAVAVDQEQGLQFLTQTIQFQVRPTRPTLGFGVRSHTPNWKSRWEQTHGPRRTGETLAAGWLQADSELWGSSWYKASTGPPGRAQVVWVRWQAGPWQLSRDLQARKVLPAEVWERSFGP